MMASPAACVPCVVVGSPSSESRLDGSSLAGWLHLGGDLLKHVLDLEPSVQFMSLTMAVGGLLSSYFHIESATAAKSSDFECYATVLFF